MIAGNDLAVKSARPGSNSICKPTEACSVESVGHGGTTKMQNVTEVTDVQEKIEVKYLQVPFRRGLNCVYLHGNLGKHKIT